MGKKGSDLMGGLEILLHELTEGGGLQTSACLQFGADTT